jgi:hypothetical protein
MEREAASPSDIKDFHATWQHTMLCYTSKDKHIIGRKKKKTPEGESRTTRKYNMNTTNQNYNTVQKNVSNLFPHIGLTTHSYNYRFDKPRETLRAA